MYLCKRVAVCQSKKCTCVKVCRCVSKWDTQVRLSVSYLELLGGPKVELGHKHCSHRINWPALSILFWPGNRPIELDWKLKTGRECRDYLVVLGGPIGTEVINTVHTVSPWTGPSNRMENTEFEIRFKVHLQVQELIVELWILCIFGFCWQAVLLGSFPLQHTLFPKVSEKARLSLRKL